MSGTLTSAIRFMVLGARSRGRSAARSLWREAMAVTGTDLSDIDLMDPDAFVRMDHHEWFTRLRAEDPVHWYEDGPGEGFWNLTKYDDVVLVNRDSALFSSQIGGTQIFSRRRAAEMGIDVDEAEAVRGPRRDHARDGSAEAHALPPAREQGLHAAHDRAAQPGAAHPRHAHHRPGDRERARPTSSPRSRRSFRCRRSPRSWACRRKTA